MSANTSAKSDEALGFFGLSVAPNGVATVTLDRPPVNAVSLQVYIDLGRLIDRVQGDPAIRVVVLRAPAGARAWCGGADLNDFVGIDVAARKARYDFINAQLPRFYRLDRPVIAAIEGPAIGIGMILAALCDLRIAAEDATFACPEIDYGLVAGGAAIFRMVGVPEAMIREMLFTGARYTAAQLFPSGFFNRVVPRDDVVSVAIGIADRMATKSLPAIRARKVASTNLEGVGWEQAYLDAQALTAELAAGQDGAEGVAAFLHGRPPAYCDR